MSKNKKSVKERIDTEEDFCYCPRLGNSISNLIDKNPMGVDNERIAKVLLTTEEEVENIFARAVAKLRKHLKMDEDE